MNISGHNWCTVHKVFESNILYELMETMCPFRYHRNNFWQAFWTHDARIPGAQMHELPQSHCLDYREGLLFSWFHINICRLYKWHMSLYIYIYIYIIYKLGFYLATYGWGGRGGSIRPHFLKSLIMMLFTWNLVHVFFDIKGTKW